ncbi:MAG: hypothetical protein ACYC0V_16175 [Armatimonadota bacterium]
MRDTNDRNMPQPFSLHTWLTGRISDTSSGRPTEQPTSQKRDPGQIKTAIRQHTDSVPKAIQPRCLNRRFSPAATHADTDDGRMHVRRFSP